MTNNNYIHVYFIALVDGLQLFIETILYMKCYPFGHIIFTFPPLFISLV